MTGDYVDFTVRKLSRRRAPISLWSREPEQRICRTFQAGSCWEVDTVDLRSSPFEILPGEWSPLRKTRPLKKVYTISGGCCFNLKSLNSWNFKTRHQESGIRKMYHCKRKLLQTKATFFQFSVHGAWKWTTRGLLATNPNHLAYFFTLSFQRDTIRRDIVVERQKTADTMQMKVSMKTGWCVPGT